MIDLAAPGRWRSANEKHNRPKPQSHVVACVLAHEVQHFGWTETLEDTVPIKRRLPKPRSLTRNERIEPSGPAHIRVTVDGTTGGPSLQINLSRADADVELSSDWLILISHYLRARFAFKSDVEMAQKLGLDRTRLIAWKKGAAVPRQEHIRFLADVATTVDALRRILHPAVVTSWLTAPKFDLGNRTPIEMLREGRLPEVLQSVNVTEHGAFI